jgi:flagellar biosynthesis GTPase FlhF
MIIINEDSPRWIRELARFISIKNLLFVYGNVHDLVSFPIQLGENEEVRWTESDLPGFFQRFLTGVGYEVVGWADPVEELTFATREMEDIFSRVEAGREIVPEHSDPKTAKERAEAERLRTELEQSCPQSMPRENAPGRRKEAADWNRTIGRISRGLENVRVPCAFVIDFASRFLSAPDHLMKEERTLFTKMLKASLTGREVVRPEGRWNNLLILVCDKLNDLPTFVYLNNPRARSISVEQPDREERGRFMNRYYRHFFGSAGVQAEAPQRLVHDFVDMTEGLTNYEMRSLVALSHKENITICDIDSGAPNMKRLSEMYKYGVTISEWDKIESDTLSHAEDFISARIKGQRMAVARVLDIVKRAKIGLSAGDSGKSHRPRGVLFFAGPTGVGKTEMAKAMAALLFGMEERLIRFDMSEYSSQHADQRLLGAPPGYLGYEEGGQLTNAVKKNPFSILLFDEIEKAHGSIFDKFLQILDDGRLTDGTGETVYFSECIIIFTSNLGTVGRSDSGASQVLVSPDMDYVQMKGIILQEVRNHFNFVLGRPEILNRFGENFVVFDFIKPPLDAEITDLLIQKLIHSARENKRLDLVVEPAARDKLVDLARGNLQHGGRGIRNIVDTAFVNPLSRFLFDSNVQSNAIVRVKELRDNGEDAPIRFELIIDVKPGLLS